MHLDHKNGSDFIFNLTFLLLLLVVSVTPVVSDSYSMGSWIFDMT